MASSPLVVLGVTGSIAAHKAIDVASQLTKAGRSVNVVLTRDAQRFVLPLPFKTLSRNPVVTDLYDEEEGWRPVHIRLADEAALLLIAPASAQTIARLALGLADVVQAEAGGVGLDTLFVDEGFGSLDPDTLEDVLTVIDGLRSNGRVVGIISHVQDLKDRVPERLEIRRERPDGPARLRVVA